MRVNSNDKNSSSKRKRVPEKERSHKQIRLYDSQTLGDIRWEALEGGAWVKEYMTPLMKLGTRHFIDNIDVEIKLLKLDNLLIPLVIVDNDYTNSYVCSPYAHYISLASDKLHVLNNKPLALFAKAALKGFGSLLKIGESNRIVYVNHTLLSTDLHPLNLNQGQLQRLTEYLQRQFPKHAIAFRSVNSAVNHPLKTALKSSSYQFIASRQIYLTNTRDSSIFETRILKSDLRFFKDSKYRIESGDSLTHQELDRIHQLYTINSVEHHSSHNPQLNPRFIRLMHEKKLFKIKVLKKEEKIVGVVGYITSDNLFICPFFGYDKDHEEKNKIYRTLSTLLILEAKANEKMFHQSAGASFYKTIRRAVAHQEYMAVKTDHLPLKQKLSWNMLKFVMNRAGIYFMKKY